MELTAETYVTITVGIQRNAREGPRRCRARGTGTISRSPVPYLRYSGRAIRTGYVNTGRGSGVCLFDRVLQATLPCRSFFSPALGYRVQPNSPWILCNRTIGSEPESGSAAGVS
jgi:hypothetical protein